MACACIASLPVAWTVWCQYLVNFPRQALSLVTCRHREITAPPRDEPTTHRLRPTLVTAIVVAAAVAGAETPVTRKHVAVPPLPNPTPSLLQHGHHQYASTTSDITIAVAVAVAYAAAAVAVVFAGAFDILIR